VQLEHGVKDAMVVRAAFERFQVTRLYSDPFYVMSYLDTWSLEFGEKRVFSWPTNRTIAMGKAIQRFHVAVLSQDHISHSNDPVLTSHVGNARVWTSGGHLLLRKESQKSVKKIDALVAAILCYEARCDSITAGEDQDPVVKRRAWSF
jgi:phage terminase large subunit-like protein